MSPTGVIYVAHSNPDPGKASAAATYTLTLSGTTAIITPLFKVNSQARDAVTGKLVKLALTDPDSTTLIPGNARTLKGRLLQVSQADGVVVIVTNPDTKQETLTRLVLSNAENPALKPTIDDIAEVTGPGTLHMVDQGAGTVSTIDTSSFTPERWSSPSPPTPPPPHRPSASLVCSTRRPGSSPISPTPSPARRAWRSCPLRTDGGTRVARPQ